MPRLTIIRGLPGSGKSTLAARLKDKDSDHYEADQYFIKDGTYNFKPTHLREAHEWCQEKTRRALERNRDVIVSNTFTSKWELEPYFKMAKKLGIIPQVITCHNNYGSIRGVPQETINKMKDRFEHDISSLF